jgi:hypothetical protein
MDIVQNCDSYINIPLSQTYRYYAELQIYTTAKIARVLHICNSKKHLYIHLFLRCQWILYNVVKGKVFFHLLFYVYLS